MRRSSLPVVTLLLLAASLPCRAREAAAPDASQAQCRAAIGLVEREAGIPAGLLHAIGRVESGRRDEATGQVGSWPWTVNAQGQGRYFPTRTEAIAHVRQLQGAGVRSIDVGCMQINLHYHPDAFPGLEQAFDPLSNVRYAARFLRELHARAGDWMRAAGHYHSHTPERAEAYRGAVAAALPAGQRDAGAVPAWNPAWSAAARTATTNNGYARGGPGGVPGGGMGAVVQRSAGTADAGRGRGLDAYRAMAIPLASRPPALLAARGG